MVVLVLKIANPSADLKPAPLVNATIFQSCTRLPSYLYHPESPDHDFHISVDPTHGAIVWQCIERVYIVIRGENRAQKRTNAPPAREFPLFLNHGAPNCATKRYSDQTHDGESIGDVARGSYVLSTYLVRTKSAPSTYQVRTLYVQCPRKHEFDPNNVGNVEKPPPIARKRCCLHRFDVGCDWNGVSKCAIINNFQGSWIFTE